MKNKKENKTEETVSSSTDRRKVLKSAVTGSAIAGAVVWKKPVIDAVLTPAHAQTSDLTISIQAIAESGDNIADDLAAFATVDTGPGGSATLSSDSDTLSDNLGLTLNITVSPPQSVPVQISWTNTDAIDTALSAPVMVQTFDNGTGQAFFSSDSILDANGTDEAQTSTISFDNASAAATTTVTLDFS